MDKQVLLLFGFVACHAFLKNHFCLEVIMVLVVGMSR